ncbi:MAG: hypothetical protein ABI699_05645, partial [Caldimonas sp.]
MSVAVTVAGAAAVATVDEIERTSEEPVGVPGAPLPPPNGEVPALPPPPPHATNIRAVIAASAHFKLFITGVSVLVE